MDILGVNLPEKSFGKPSMPQDGSSFKETLFESSKARSATPLFFDHASGRALRLGAWKIVMRREKGSSKEWELYNLKNDPSELKDLAKSNPEMLLKLVKEWERLSKLMKQKQEM